MRFHPLPSIPSLEPLEARLLLSADIVAPLLATFDGMLTSPAGETVSLIQGSGVTSQTFIDAGDFYWCYGKQISLLRLANEAVVRFRDPTTAQSALSQVTAPGGVLEGYEWSRSLDPEVLVFIKQPGGEINFDALNQGLHASGIAEWAAPAFVDAQTGSPLYTGDAIIVALKPGVDPNVFFQDFAGHRRLSRNEYVVTVQGGGLATLEAANRLYGAAEVEWACPNFRIQATPMETVPNDNLYSSQWYLENTGQNDALAGADAHLPEAWDTTTGSSSIVIAVLDDGVQTDHPDLEDNIFVNELEANGQSGVDDDGNGRIDDVSGYDFFGDGSEFSYDNNANPSLATDNHGTAVAGIIAACGNNTGGVAGATWNSRILPIRAMGSTIYVDKLAAAIRYAAGLDANGDPCEHWQGAHIINFSWGLGGSDPAIDAAFHDAATEGRGGLGCAVFVAAGNSATGYSNRGLTSHATVAPESTWSWVLGYEKNASGTAGADTVWLGEFTNSDGIITRFDSPTAPAGWLLTPFVGFDGWQIVDDPAHAWGTGRYEVRASAIGNDEEAYIMAPAFTVSGTTIPVASFWAWQSSETNDILHYFLYNWDTDSFADDGHGWWGANPTTTTSVSYPANLDNDVIAVGASTDWDYRAAYSQYGSALDFVAPSSGGYAGITTTDREGSAGYATGDYTDSFGGTSAAAPLAAGIGALLLSENPGLTATQIREIMRASADPIGNVTYTNDFNTYYGYGRVNAEEALGLIGPDITANIVDVDPDPRGTSVSSIEITFSQPVSNFDINDLTLKCEGDVISWEGTDAVLDHDVDYDTFTLSGLSDLTGDPGKYELLLTAEGSLITGAEGDYLSGNATDVWYMNAVNTGTGNDTVKLSRDGTLTKVDINNGATVYWLDPAGFPILNVNTDGGEDTLTVDFSDGNPIPAAGIAFAGGDDTDTLEIIGTSGDDELNYSTGQAVLNPNGINATVNFTGVEKHEVELGDEDDTITVDSGSFLFTNDLGPSGDDLTVTLTLNNSAVVTFDASQHLAGLTLNNTAAATLTAGGAKVLTTKAITVAAGARLDLSDNDLVVNYTGLDDPVATIRGYLVAGYNSTTQLWTGNGIVSSTADGIANATTLGYRDDTTAKTVTVKYTYLGDLDLSGTVTLTDYSLFVTGYNSHGDKKGWEWGDLDYSGSITLTDYSLFISGYSKQGDPL